MILVALVLVVLTVAAWIRIRYPFWSLQPVFHPYDLWRYFGPRGVIRHQCLPTKFLQQSKVKTIAFLDATDEEMGGILDLLQCHHVPSEHVTFDLTEDVLRLIGSHHVSGQCWVSTIPDQGVLLSYPVRFVARGLAPYSLFYWDYVTMHRNHKAAVHTLIQTHAYNQARREPDIPASLFRKDGALADVAIVPLVTFTVSRFELIRQRVKKPPLPAPLTVTRVRGDTIHVLMDCLFDLTKGDGHDVLLFPDMTAMQARMDANQWFVYVLQSTKNTVEALYVFRDTNMIYEDVGKRGLECLVSISVVKTPFFFAGWLHALSDILLVQEFGWMAIPSLGENATLIATWKWKYNAISTHDAAFYLYNYVCPTVQPERCWIAL